MSTKSRIKRNHHARGKRAFPGQHEDVELEICFFHVDGQYTSKPDAALAARRAGRDVKVIPQLCAIGRVVPPEEWVADLGDPPQQQPSE